jgi:hypothetical protein
MKPTDMILANAADGGSTFAILQSDSFFVPYGEYPHKQGLQIFDRAAADAIIANHNGVLAKVGRWARGDQASYPVYIGHPDLPGSKDTDKRAYGWIENLRADDDGLHLGVKWSEQGRELVENAHFKFYSPLWWSREKGKKLRPVILKSMGLTNDPNIPVPALANESDTEDFETEDTSQQLIEDNMNEILAALGLEDGATLEDALAKIAALTEAAELAATEKAAADAKAAEEEAAKMAEAEKLAAAENEAKGLRASLTIAANAAVATAVAAGKLTPAEAESKATEILAANDFAAALQDLGKLNAKVKVTSVTGDLGSAKTRLVIAANDQAKAQREERARLVENEFQNTNPQQSLGERKRIAWQRAQRKNPEVFGKVDHSSEPAA